VRAEAPRRSGDRLPSSYINFYIANKWSSYPCTQRRDAAAMRTLRRLFPPVRWSGVATLDVLLGGGNIHCITHQRTLPATS